MSVRDPVIVMLRLCFRSTIRDAASQLYNVAYSAISFFMKFETFRNNVRLSEYGGRWKMLHYFAKRFFSPVLVSPYIDQGYMSTSLKIYVVNDLRRQFEDVRVNVLVYRWSSLTPVRSLEIALPVALVSDYKGFEALYAESKDCNPTLTSFNGA